MSFFGELFGSEAGQESLTAEQAFAGILLSVISVDGQVTSEETSDFNATLQRANLMRKVTNNEFNNMMKELQRLLRKSGPKDLVTACAEFLPTELANGTFAYACDLVFSDGDAAEEEQKLLDHIKKELNIEDSLAYKVGEVLLIKNRI